MSPGTSHWNLRPDGNEGNQVVAKTAGNGQRRRLKPEERKDELLSNAYSMIYEGGLEALTMEGLAAKSGVNKALPYHYFGTRDGVLIGLAERSYGILLGAFEEAESRASGLEAKLKALINTWIDNTQPWKVIRALETVRERFPELNRSLLVYEVKVASLISGVFASEKGMKPDMALMMSAQFVGSAQGLAWAWPTSGWSRKRLVDVWLKMNMAGLRSMENG